MTALFQSVCLNGVWAMMNDLTYIYHYTSPIGGITLASDGESLTGLWFDGQKYFPHKLIEESSEAELPIFTQTCNWLDIYFGGKEPGFTPPISLHTTPFRKVVYDILLTIPYLVINFEPRIQSFDHGRIMIHSNHIKTNSPELLI